MRLAKPEMSSHSAMKTTTNSQDPQLFKLVFLTFLTVNAIAAWHAPILDCDEVFNYWEPTHYVNQGYGLQTWEYAPEYAIRSWLYILSHAIIGQTARFKVRFESWHAHEFITIRFALAGACAFCQSSLFKAVYKTMEPRVALLTALIMTTSTGMFYASVAYLPSSFSMYTAMLGTAAFLEQRSNQRTTEGVSWFGIGAIVGWPFSGALIIPLMGEELAAIRSIKNISPMVRRAGLGVLHLLPIMLLDVITNVVFLHRAVFSPWRIVSYNIFSGSSRGPNIFGTEPWHFYIRNLLLNFNLWSVLALLAGPVVLARILLRLPSMLRISQSRLLFYVAPFYLWLAIFSVQPHKEERFMYPAYPFLCLNAAITLHILISSLGHAQPGSVVARVPGLMKAALVAVVISAFIVIGMLRTIGTISAYNAPLKVYEPLQTMALENSNGSICLGKEWYRYPSSYFLPSNARARFVKNDFSGLLPGQFSEERNSLGIPAAWKASPGMNDQNLEDFGKYVPMSSCDFLVDSQSEGSPPSKLEPNYIGDTNQWDVVVCHKFLDASRTPILPRVFWTPESDLLPKSLRRYWGKYCLLKRKTAPASSTT